MYLLDWENPLRQAGEVVFGSRDRTWWKLCAELWKSVLLIGVKVLLGNEKSFCSWHPGQLGGTTFGPGQSRLTQSTRSRPKSGDASEYFIEVDSDESIIS